MRLDQIFSLAILLILLGLLAVTLSRVEVALPAPSERVEPPAPLTLPPSPTGELLTVFRVVDGDTFELTDQNWVRLIGIDTPELDDFGGRDQCLAREAKFRLEELLADKVVRLERGVENIDRYRRLLRYVYLPDGTFVNEELVKEGYAKILTIPPNVRYVHRFLAAQEEARQAQRGLWDPAACP